MRSHKSIAVYLLVALVAFCFISAPAYCDHPWDIDWDGDGDDTVDPGSGQVSSSDVTYDKGDVTPPSTQSTQPPTSGTWSSAAGGGILPGFVFDWVLKGMDYARGWFDKAELSMWQHGFRDKAE